MNRHEIYPSIALIDLDMIILENRSISAYITVILGFYSGTVLY